MNTLASSSGQSLRTALTMLAAFIAGVLAASSTATLTLRATSIVAGASVLVFLSTCIVWSQRQARRNRLAHSNPLDHGKLHTAMLRDITGRVIDEEALAETEEDLRALLDNFGLVAAIDQLADGMSQRYGMCIARRFDIGSAVLPRGVATVAYRLVQDATATAARHAQASRITLSMRVNDGHCTLHIVDDGPFPSGGKPGDRFTLSITFKPNALQPDSTQP